MTSKHFRPAFTLIELLVVISIIALLIAILLPALGAARRSARNAECLSRMRSISIAVAAYEVDNKGFLPRGHGGNPSNPLFATAKDAGYYLSDYIEEYMDIADDQNTDFYLCPESTLVPGVNQKRVSYSAFDRVLVNRDQAEFNFKLLRSTDIKRPTEVIAFGDAAQNSGAGTSGTHFTDGGAGYVGPFTNVATRDDFIVFPENLNADGLAAPNNGYFFRYRHNSNQTANAGFIDGHAESFVIGQVQQKNFSTAY